MNPKNDRTSESAPRKRFRLEKIEERVAPRRFRIDRLEGRVAPSGTSSDYPGSFYTLPGFGHSKFRTY